MVDSVIRLLSSLPGVRSAAVVDPRLIPEIVQRERIAEKHQFVPLENLGMREVLRRQHLTVILKDLTFRPPPCPTVYLVEEVDNAISVEGTTFEVCGRCFHIIGEEIFNKHCDYDEEHFLLGDSFVLFPARRRLRSHIPAFMLLPPIPFPELEQVTEPEVPRNVASVSPGARTDQLLRSEYNFSVFPDYATIIIGWDSRG